MISLRKFKNGEFIAREGEAGSEMFILLEGTMEVTQKLTLFDSDSRDFDNRDKMLIRLNPDSRPIVGEMMLFEDEHTRSATMKALGNVIVGVIKKESLLNLVRDNPNLGYTIFYNIGLVLSARLRKANEDILKLTTAFSLALERGW